jgi:3''-phosphoadenosine 5''-phosphosulfate sulfotransferase (PAPS reductase)/FAD synthetase and related enzymes
MPGWTSCPSHPDVVSCPPTRSVAQASEIAPSETHSVSSSRLLQAVYIVSRDPFPEVEEFVEKSAQHYHLDLKRYELPMRPALEAYLKDKPAVKAIFLGTRRTDPHSEALSHFNPTDQGWPQFMRIHPIIDWHYVEIWAVSRIPIFRLPSSK